MKRCLSRTHGPTPEQRRQTKDKVAARLLELSRTTSYWLCRNCFGVNTREEDDHGQPHYCSTCGSHHFTLEIPELIEPEDLR